MECTIPRRCLFIEWQPNENILIANDNLDHDQEGDWALVDTISKRTRTTSECKVFNTKSNSMGSSGTSISKQKLIRIPLEELSSIEVKHRGQTIRFLKKIDGSLHMEFFFQHGNAELFVSSMRKLHVIENSPTTRNGEEYVILSTEKQKLKKTFAELDIGEIKSRSGPDSWLPNKVVGFLVNIPDYVQPPFHKVSPKSRPGAIHELKLSTSSSTVELSNSSAQSSASSLDKSPTEQTNENVTVAIKLPDRPAVSRGI